MLLLSARAKGIFGVNYGTYQAKMVSMKLPNNDFVFVIETMHLSKLIQLKELGPRQVTDNSYLAGIAKINYTTE